METRRLSTTKLFILANYVFNLKCASYIQIFFIVVLEKHLLLTDVHQEHSTYTQGKAPSVTVR